MRCAECSDKIQEVSRGVFIHVDLHGDVNHDMDADHVAISEDESRVLPLRSSYRDSEDIGLCCDGYDE